MWLVPAGDPPQKQGGDLASAKDRYEMVRLAASSCGALFVSDMELQRQGRSYTFDTVKEILLQDPETEYLFFLGMDAMIGIRTWYCWEELLALIGMRVMTRPDNDPILLDAALAGYERQGDTWRYPGRPEIRLVPVPPLTMSSTGIRERIRAGQPIADLVPDAVCHYIGKKGLYR